MKTTSPTFMMNLICEPDRRHHPEQQEIYGCIQASDFANYDEGENVESESNSAPEPERQNCPSLKIIFFRGRPA